MKIFFKLCTPHWFWYIDQLSWTKYLTLSRLPFRVKNIFFCQDLSDLKTWINYFALLDWFIHRVYPQNGICFQKYYFWPKNDGGKWSRKNILEIPPCYFLLLHKSAQNHKFSNKNNHLLAWKDFKIIFSRPLSTIIFWPNGKISPTFHFQLVNKGWIIAILCVK